MFKFASLLLDPAATSQTGFTEGVQTFGEFKNSVSTEGPSPSRSVLPEGFDSSAEISFDENAPAPESTLAPEQTETESELAPAPAPAPAPKPDKKSSDPKFELEEEQPEPEPEPPKQKKQQAPLPQQQPTQQQKLSRNYEGLPPEVVELLKELHNTPYSKVS